MLRSQFQNTIKWNFNHGARQPFPCGRRWNVLGDGQFKVCSREMKRKLEVRGASGQTGKPVGWGHVHCAVWNYCWDQLQKRGSSEWPFHFYTGLFPCCEVTLTLGRSVSSHFHSPVISIAKCSPSLVAHLNPCIGLALQLSHESLGLVYVLKTLSFLLFL